METVKSHLAERFRSSGKTQDAFCRANGITIHTLRYYLYKKNKRAETVNKTVSNDINPPLPPASFIRFSHNTQCDSNQKRYPVTIIRGKFTMDELRGLICDYTEKAPC